MNIFDHFEKIALQGGGAHSALPPRVSGQKFSFTSKVTHHFQLHILVAYLICNMTTFHHFKKIAWGGAYSAPPGVGGQIFFSQTRVFQMKGPCKNSRFYYQSSGRAPSGLCSLFGIIWGHYGDLEGHALFSSSYSCGIFQKLSFDMQHDYILTTLKKSQWGAHSAPILGVGANFLFTY